MKHSETALQIAIVDFLLLNEDPAVWTFFHCPNGELRDKRTAAKLKAMGVRAGVPDIIIDKHGVIIYVEIKMPKGRLSDTQKIWREAADQRGSRYYIVHSVNEMGWVLDALRILIKARVTA